MNAVDRVKAICKNRKIAIYKLEKDLGYANGYIGQLKKGVFPSDRLIEIANYLGITTEEILTGEKTQEKEKTATNGDDLSLDEMNLVSRFNDADEQTKAAIRILLGM